ncbi:MAG: sulfite exporter TauE/SafE family protein [Sulfurimonadaceae bacterium]|jgi:sulfite exporter TauE/SafE|nr:sulfite exporter TauE/SafE family protein [Sulfurimonadaceae bacterium]
MEIISFSSIATIAFLGSFGHCIGMCGGIVLAYSATKIDPTRPIYSKAISHLLYSFGRVFTYTLLGGVFGFIGGVATFNHIANGVLLIVAGVVMVLAALSLMGVFNFLTTIEHSFSSTKWYKDSFRAILNSKSPSSFFTLGMLNGLLPCGFVYFFAITAASSGSSVDGALVMFVFGVATIPAMFAMGFLSSLAKATKVRKTMMILSSIAILIYGIFTLYNGYGFIVDETRTLNECH